MKSKIGEVTERETDNIIKDIRNFLVGQDECLTNQQCVYFEAMLRGCVLKDWFECNLSASEYDKCDKILARLGVACHIKCWKHRNEANSNPI